MSEIHAELREWEQVLLVRARAGDEAAFAELAGRFRRELQVHCYRIVGSVQDAEDIVQETLLAAWRGLEGFEGRASMRTWLYTIATNRSLNALRARGRRMPEPPAPPADPPSPPPPAPTRELEPIWLEPYPDELLEGVLDRAEEPDALYDAREAIGLAFIAGLQRLPPRQRAVLVLRDVLGFRAAEVAEMLEVSVAAANGGLRRARASLREDSPGLRHEDAPLPGSEAERATVDRFVDAFEDGDVDGVVALLSDAATLTMPPQPLEYRGPAAIGGFFSTVPAGGRLEQFRLVATRANGQPAFGCYLRDPRSSIAHAYGLMVLTLRKNRIAAITGFPRHRRLSAVRPAQDASRLARKRWRSTRNWRIAFAASSLGPKGLKANSFGAGLNGRWHLRRQVRLGHGRDDVRPCREAARGRRG